MREGKNVAVVENNLAKIGLREDSEKVAGNKSVKGEKGLLGGNSHYVMLFG